MNTRIVATLLLLGFPALPLYAGEPEARFPVSMEHGPIQATELQGALQLLGVNMYRFSYSVPFVHAIKYRACAYVSGKEQPLGDGDVKGLEPGKQAITVITRKSEGMLDLTVTCGRDSDVPRNLLGGEKRAVPLSLDGYGPRGSSVPPNVTLEAGKEVPIWVFSASSGQWSMFTGRESIQDYAKRTDLVVVVYVTLLG
ncbi:hypothetical protein JXA88_12885 [Candidatus Fermentibacteria bacterium]|nr:hypothetical protein [Candidatus Fermentibacteria bacterium]